MSKSVLNIANVQYRHWGNGKKFEAKIGNIGDVLNSRKLGCSVIVLPPGKSAFPFHSHRMNEEMFLVLEGLGTVRIGNKTYRIKKGDIVAAPSGNRSTAHKIVNTSKRGLKYLAVTTKISPDIVEYPDSKKIAVLAKFPRKQGKPEWFYIITKNKSASPDEYWAGE